MAVDLSDYVESLRREVTPLGEDALDVSDDDLLGYLSDAFWQARLDGFLGEWEADEFGLVTPVAAGGDDITRDAIALVLLYAGVRILRLQVWNGNVKFKAKAGSVEFEQESSALVQAEMLRQLERVKIDLLQQKKDAEYGSTDAFLVDGYTVRQSYAASYLGRLADSLVN